MLPPEPENQEQLSVMVQIAQTYVTVDPAQSAEILGTVIERLDRLVPAMQTLDGFMYRGGGSFRNGEMLLTNSGMLGGMFMQLGGAIGSLAQQNLDLANSVAQKMDLPEVRANMRLNIVQSALGRDSRRGGIIVRSGSFVF